MKIQRTSHKFTKYELDIIRQSLFMYMGKTTNEQAKMTAMLIFDRLNREYKDQIKELRQNDKEND